MADKTPRPYLPIDLDWLETYNADRSLLLGRPGGAVVVRLFADDPDEVPADYQRGHDYVVELIRLARIGQKLESKTKAAVALREDAGPLTQ